MNEAYSQVASDQLDALEAGDPVLYNAVLDVCELIFTFPAQAQRLSRAIREQGGTIVLALPVRGSAEGMKVFWTSDGPRVEAVFPYERD